MRNSTEDAPAKRQQEGPRPHTIRATPNREPTNTSEMSSESPLLRDHVTAVANNSGALAVQQPVQVNLSEEFMMMHHMAHARRHTLAREMPLTQRVKRLQTGATFMSAIKKAKDSPLGRVDENSPVAFNENLDGVEQRRTTGDFTDQADDDHGLSGQIKRQAFAASTKSRLDAEWQEQSPGDSNSPQSPLMHGIDPYAHEKFLFFILEETMLIEKDEGMVAPPCHCGIECDLHKVTETKEEVWVCSEASCMYYQPCGLDNNDGSVDELAIDAGETEVPPQFNTVEEFWDYFDKMITTPEKEIVDFLISTQNKKITILNTR